MSSLNQSSPELIQREFAKESDAVTYLMERLSPYYNLYKEVQVEHFDNSRLRIDLIALPKSGFARINTHRCIGIEIKAGYREGKDFIRALQQCIDYRHSTICDPRSNDKRGMIPDLVLLFPDFTERPYGYDKQWRGGLVRLAGRFNVGVVHEFWHHWEQQVVTQFSIADTRVWDNVRGATGIRNFGTARKRGSQ